VNLYVAKKNARSHEDGGGEVDGSTSHEIDAWAIDFRRIPADRISVRARMTTPPSVLCHLSNHIFMFPRATITFFSYLQYHIPE
jgi:hypothetical protein